MPAQEAHRNCLLERALQRLRSLLEASGARISVSEISERRIHHERERPCLRDGQGLLQRRDGALGVAPQQITDAEAPPGVEETVGIVKVSGDAASLLPTRPRFGEF